MKNHILLLILFILLVLACCNSCGQRKIKSMEEVIMKNKNLIFYFDGNEILLPHYKSVALSWSPNKLTAKERSQKHFEIMKYRNKVSEENSALRSKSWTEENRKYLDYSYQYFEGYFYDASLGRVSFTVFTNQNSEIISIHLRAEEEKHEFEESFYFRNDSIVCMERICSESYGDGWGRVGHEVKEYFYFFERNNLFAYKEVQRKLNTSRGRERLKVGRLKSKNKRLSKVFSFFKQVAEDLKNNELVKCRSTNPIYPTGHKGFSSDFLDYETQQKIKDISKSSFRFQRIAEMEIDQDGQIRVIGFKVEPKAKRNNSVNAEFEKRLSENIIKRLEWNRWIPASQNCQSVRDTFELEISFNLPSWKERFYFRKSDFQ